MQVVFRPLYHRRHSIRQLFVKGRVYFCKIRLSSIFERRIFRKFKKITFNTVLVILIVKISLTSRQKYNAYSTATPIAHRRRHLQQLLCYQLLNQLQRPLLILATMFVKTVAMNSTIFLTRQPVL